MFELTNGVLIIKQGDSGDTVKYIQELLSITPQDSSYGPKTKLAVQQFQRTNGLIADGVVGPSTFIKMCRREINIQFYRSRSSLVIQLESSHYSGIREVFECRAISGLPMGHTRISELIKKGREDLNKTTNYMRTEHDDVSDVGPIPNGSYDLDLVTDMPYQKTGGGWGVGGWYLDPGFFSRAFYRGGLTRGGFFLHQDGNGVGTGGCIGVTLPGKMRAIRSILTTYQTTGVSTTIEIDVH